MKDEYDFRGAARGKFFRPGAKVSGPPPSGRHWLAWVGVSRASPESSPMAVLQCGCGVVWHVDEGEGTEEVLRTNWQEHIASAG